VCSCILSTQQLHHFQPFLQVKSNDDSLDWLCPRRLQPRSRTASRMSTDPMVKARRPATASHVVVGGGGVVTEKLQPFPLRPPRQRQNGRTVASGWVASVKPHATQPVEVHTIPRVAPTPIASGISVRKTPKPSLQQVCGSVAASAPAAQQTHVGGTRNRS